jgi:hypothetical protein
MVNHITKEEQHKSGTQCLGLVSVGLPECIPETVRTSAVKVMKFRGSWSCPYLAIY